MSYILVILTICFSLSGYNLCVAATSVLPPQSKLSFPGGKNTKRFAADSVGGRIRPSAARGGAPSPQTRQQIPVSPSVSAVPSVLPPQPISTSLQTKPTIAQASNAARSFLPQLTVPSAQQVAGNVGKLSAAQLQPFTQTATAVPLASMAISPANDPILASRKNVKGLIKKAERDVQAECTKPDDGTCAKFCVAIYAKEANVTERDRKVATCQQECTPGQRCKINPIAGPDDEAILGNKELFTQTRDQLAAAVAEARDPKGKRTGRRMIPWQDIQAPEFKRIMDAIGSGVPQEEVAYQQYVVDRSVKMQQEEIRAEALAKALEASAPTSTANG